ncbi:carbohydrate esterase family 4 protein [Multifurca ochricompacta]|uniref:chitin deacetylase n=1 Tax=Multifurca ochricompacta TaxID=376703 RepID=A0AAD4LW50_9AGAM|nr:carbohydrate esterase family 4 protein [Multifurca ochricompacta]
MFDWRALSLFITLLAASSVLAQPHISKRSKAKRSDPNQECTPYYYPPSEQYIHKFPPIWQPATLLPNDSAGQAMWTKISGSIPTNIQPKGQPGDSTANVNYNSQKDPDCWWTKTQCTKPKLKGLPLDVASIPEPRSMGYGFDDGPNCSHNAFYDYLASQNQKATMYFIGSNVLNWPREAQRALADGHEICVHTWSHHYMTAFQSRDAFAELWYSLQAVKAVVGVTPTCWRPPYGDVDDRIRAIANALGLRTIMWKYDSNDWRAVPSEVDASYNSFVHSATAGEFNTVGAIMLTHELNTFTMQEAMKWYPQLKSAFKYIVPVGVALNKTRPYEEGNHLLPTFQQYTSGQTTVG